MSFALFIQRGSYITRRSYNVSRALIESMFYLVTHKKKIQREKHKWKYYREKISMMISFKEKRERRMFKEHRHIPLPPGGSFLTHS